MSIGKYGRVVSIVKVFQDFLTNVFKHFFVGDSGSFGLIKGPVTSMKPEIFFWEHVLIIVDFLDPEGLSVHVDNKFLVVIDLVFFERTYSNYDLDTITLAWHDFKKEFMIIKCKI